MKLVNVVETTDPTVQPSMSLGCDCGCQDESMRERPLATEADLIAAAAPRGEVYGRRIIDLFETHDDVDDCWWCTAPAEVVFSAVQENRLSAVRSFGWGSAEPIPEWDPTLRF